MVIFVIYPLNMVIYLLKIGDLPIQDGDVSIVMLVYSRGYFDRPHTWIRRS